MMGKNLLSHLPNSDDFTEEEEKIYSEAANAYYGNNYKNKSLHDLYEGEEEEEFAW